MRAVLLVAPLCSCAIAVAGLEPKPNLPPLLAGSLTLELDESIKQEAIAEGIGVLYTAHFSTLRGDLKRAFANAGLKATSPSALKLTLSSVEPQTAKRGLLLFTRLRFRGALSSGDRVLQSFAGEVEDTCPFVEAFPDCFQHNVEQLFERTFKELGPALEGLPPEKPRQTPPTEI